MASGAVHRQLERVFGEGAVAGLSEGQLLDRFVSGKDGVAFEALVARHGPMVYSVCRRYLRDPNDVDDAFQATFLVLVRRAGSLRRQELLANWLYGVAYKVAVRARANSARRGSSEGAETLAAVDPVPVDSDDGVHEEVRRLPEKYRAPVVLCYLEGLTHEEAADRLRCPVGTVKGRLARARDLLRTRLVRRGLTLASALVAIDRVASEVPACLPDRLVETTTKVVTAATGKLAIVAGAAPAVRAITLSEGVIHAMTVSQFKNVAAVGTVAAAFLTGAGAFAYQQGGFGSSGDEQKAVVKGSAASAAPTKGEQGQKSTATRAGGATKGSGGMMPVMGGGMGGGAGAGFGGPGMTGGAPGGMMPGMGGGGMMGAGGGQGGGGFGGGGSDAESTAVKENRMRVAIVELAPKVLAEDKTPQTQSILKKLDQPISMNFFHETPLEDVIKYIKSATQGPNDSGIPIYIDPVGLEEAEKSMTSPVRLDLEGVPLKTSFRLLLKQLGLAYCVRDGLIIVSSVRGVHQELMEAAGAAGIVEVAAPIIPQAGGGFR